MSSQEAPSFAECGTILVQELEQLDLAAKDGGSLTVQHSRYLWRPHSQIELPNGFEFSLDCIFGSDGVRRFFPTYPDVFVRQAFLAGNVIAENYGPYTKEYASSARVMHFLNQKAPHLQEFLRRSFRQTSELVPRTKRVTSEFRDILPDTIGTGADGKGARWSVSDFLSAGMEQVKGKPNTGDAEVVIRLALLVAAKQNPVDIVGLSELHARSSVRRGLLKLGPIPSSEVPSEERELVVVRFLECLEGHLDDSTEQFRQWWLHKHGDLLGSISRKKDGGTIDRDHVRQVLLDLVFDSYLYAAKAIEIAMRQFAAAIESPLTDAEAAIFGMMFYRQSWLGGLSLVLLQERVPLLRECGQELLHNPGGSEWKGVTLRMLEYYGDMCEKRRLADIRIKEKKRHGIGGIATFDLENDMQVATKRAFTSKSADEAAGILRAHFSLECDCPGFVEWQSTCSRSDDTHPIDFDFACPECGRHNSCAVTQEDLLNICTDFRESLEHR